MKIGYTETTLRKGKEERQVIEMVRDAVQERRGRMQRCGTVEGCFQKETVEYLK